MLTVSIDNMRKKEGVSFQIHETKLLYLFQAVINMHELTGDEPLLCFAHLVKAPQIGKAIKIESGVE